MTKCDLDLEITLLLSELELALRMLTPSNLKSHCGLIANLQQPLELEEKNLSAAASLGRYAEFVAGRNCLKETIKKVTLRKPVIGRTTRGLPKLPSGLTGSISHKYPYVTSVAGLKSEILSVGIDIEIVDSWEPNTVSVFSTDQDFIKFEELGMSYYKYSSLLFSIKESAFKCFSALNAYEQVTLKTLSPEITLVNEIMYEFSLQMNALKCSGRAIVVNDTWAIATCWIFKKS